MIKVAGKKKKEGGVSVKITHYNTKKVIKPEKTGVGRDGLVTAWITKETRRLLRLEVTKQQEKGLKTSIPLLIHNLVMKKYGGSVK